MRAVRDIRPPGVYPAVEEPGLPALIAADTRIAGFVGLAQEGPMDVPRLITGWSEFVDVYGGLSEGFLGKAVEGFFLNGGQSCYVVRVAHRPPRGEPPGALHASSSSWAVSDGWGKPTLLVSA